MAPVELSLERYQALDLCNLQTDFLLQGGTGIQGFS